MGTTCEAIVGIVGNSACGVAIPSFVDVSMTAAYLLLLNGRIEYLVIEGPEVRRKWAT